MSEVRSAAAQAGHIDTEMLLFEAAAAFHDAKTLVELDAQWARLVRPAYTQLSEQSLGILNHLYGLNCTVIQRGDR